MRLFKNMRIPEDRDYFTLNEMRSDFTTNYSMGTFGYSIRNKFELIGLLTYLHNEIRKKKPDVSMYQILQKIRPDTDDALYKRIVVIAEEFAYYVGPNDFESFGVPLKDMPNRIGEILDTFEPF